MSLSIPPSGPGKPCKRINDQSAHAVMIYNVIPHGNEHIIIHVNVPRRVLPLLKFSRFVCRRNVRQRPFTRPQAHVPQLRNPLRFFDPPPTKRAIGFRKDRVNERDTQEKDGIFVCVKFREREGLNRVRDDKNGVSHAIQ